MLNAERDCPPFASTHAHHAPHLRLSSIIPHTHTPSRTGRRVRSLSSTTALRTTTPRPSPTSPVQELTLGPRLRRCRPHRPPSRAVPLPACPLPLHHHQRPPQHPSAGPQPLHPYPLLIPAHRRPPVPTTDPRQVKLSRRAPTSLPAPRAQTDVSWETAWQSLPSPELSVWLVSWSSSALKGTNPTARETSKTCADVVHRPGDTRAPHRHTSQDDGLFSPSWAPPPRANHHERFSLLVTRYTYDTLTTFSSALMDTISPSSILPFSPDP